MHRHTLLGKSVSALCEGQRLYPPQPGATMHTPLWVWDTDSAPLPCPSCPAKPSQRNREQGLERKSQTRAEKSHAWEGYCIALVGGGEREGGGARQRRAILLQTLSLRRSDPWRALAILLPAGRSQLRAIRVEAEKAPL